MLAFLSHYYEKKIEDNEKETVIIQRRGIRAKKNILKGEILKRLILLILDLVQIECLPPNKKNLVIGKKTNTNIIEGDSINLNNV